MRILFPLMLAVFYIVASILKAKSKKAEDDKAGGKQLSGKPESKPADGISGLLKGHVQQIRRAIEAEMEKQRQLQDQQAQRKVDRPRPAQQIVAPEIKYAEPPTSRELVEESQLPLHFPKVEPTIQELPELKPGIEELPELTSKTVEKMEDIRMTIPTEQAISLHLPEILSDYSDPEQIRRAILHYEILGKPLSIRGPEQKIMGL